MRSELLRRGGYVLYFRDVSRPYRVSEGRLRRTLGLKRVRETPDGNVYAASSKTRAR
jgi:hypothetical protein